MFSKNTVYSFKLAILSLRLFTFFRFLTLCVAIDAPLSLPPIALLHAFLIGLKYDMFVLMHVLLPVIVFSHLPGIGAAQSRKTRTVLSSFIVVLLCLFSLSLTADMESMRVVGSRFYFTDMAYLNDFGESAKVLVMGLHLPFYLVLWIAVCGGVARQVHHITRSIAGPGPAPPRWARIAAPLVLFLIFPAVTLSGFSVLRWGGAFFSEYPKLNELALNGPYVLAYSYKEVKRQGKMIQAGDRQEVIQRVRQLLSNDSFRFVNTGGILRESSVERNVDPYDVVIIIMESFGAEHVGVLGAERSLSPSFDRLAQQGLLFDHFYANGDRTNKGLPALLFSYPDYLPGIGLMRSINHRRSQFSSLAALLKEKGYQTLFATGGQIEFDNMKGFMQKNGFDRLIGFSDFNMLNESVKDRLHWAVPDEVLFDRADKEFTEYANRNQHFFGAVLTLSNHTPYMLPAHYNRKFPDLPKELRAFHYSDWALGQFMEKAKRSPYYKNTIFVITADHCNIHIQYPEALGYKRFHIPLLLYAPDRIKPGVSSTLGSQLDLLPTLIQFLGLKAPFKSFGTSLFGKTETRFSISKLGSKFHILRDGFYLQTDFLENAPHLFPAPSSLPAEENREEIEQILKDSRMFVAASYALLN